jgi:hypothetical protein
MGTIENFWNQPRLTTIEAIAVVVAATINIVTTPTESMIENAATGVVNTITTKTIVDVSTSPLVATSWARWRAPVSHFAGQERRGEFGEFQAKAMKVSYSSQSEKIGYLYEFCEGAMK